MIFRKVSTWTMNQHEAKIVKKVEVKNDERKEVCQLGH